MTTCLEFRRRVGAEPFADEAEIEAHRRECAACARHQDGLRAMDGVIRQALQVNLSPRGTAAAQPARRWQPRLLAIAASLVAGVAVGFAVLVAAPRAAIAREVVGHVAHEPEALVTTAPLATADVAAVLDPLGMRLDGGVGEISFAERCEFEGQVVPHIVVQTPQGPVTLLVLSHRPLARAVRFERGGYAGVVLPAPRGAVAVVGRGVEDFDAVAQQVIDGVDWGA